MPEVRPIKLCLHWPTFGPYHIARLMACREYGAREGFEVHALETAGDDVLYHWGEGATDDPHWHCMFPDAVFQELSPGVVRTRVFETLDRIDPDGVAICSYSFPDARACLEWCRKNRRVAVMVTDTREEDTDRRIWKEKIKSRIIRQYDSAFVSGSSHRRYLEKLGYPPERIRIGYSVVDNSYFARAKCADVRQTSLPGLSDQTPIFLASSRFIARKNLFFLLDAYQTYRQGVEDPWNLVILGNGKLESELRHHIGQAEIGGVFLPGFRSHEEIIHYYSAAGAFVHPALAEQWGLVVNEAMAAGLPVLVSTATGCAEDLVRDGENGFTFEPTDLNGLAAHMVRLHCEPDLRNQMGEASAGIIEHWDLANFCDQLFGAFVAGCTVSDRSMAMDVRLVLLGLRLLGRNMTSFHDVEA